MSVSAACCENSAVIPSCVWEKRGTFNSTFEFGYMWAFVWETLQFSSWNNLRYRPNSTFIPSSPR